MKNEYKAVKKQKPSHGIVKVKDSVLSDIFGLRKRSANTVSPKEVDPKLAYFFKHAAGKRSINKFGT